MPTSASSRSRPADAIKVLKHPCPVSRCGGTSSRVQDNHDSPPRRKASGEIYAWHLRDVEEELERTQGDKDALQHRIRLAQISHLGMRGVLEQNYRDPSDASKVDWEQVHVHFKAMGHAEAL